MLERKQKKGRYLQFSLGALLIFTVLAGAGMGWYFARFRRWAAQLEIPEQREQALFNLLQAQRYRGVPNYTETSPSTLDECRINHVVTCPQAGGGTIYAVFRVPEYSGEEKIGPGKPFGWLSLIDSDGFIECVYGGCNVIHGEFKSLLSDARVQNVETWNCSNEGGPTVSVLKVVPITHSAKPLLHVAYDWGEVPKTWDWRTIDLDGDGVYEIQLGTVNNGFEAKITYRWSKAEQRFDGPDGGVDEHFMRLSNENYWPEIKVFSDAKARQTKAAIQK
jgi:hypothetical protein